MSSKYGRLQCNKCGRYFKSEAAQEHHSKAHDGYQCKICAKIFPLTLELSHHYEIAHLGNRAKCKFCDQGFKRQIDLNQHLKRGQCKAKYLAGDVQSAPLETLSTLQKKSNAADLSKWAEDIAWNIQKVKQERQEMRVSFLEFQETLPKEDYSNGPLLKYVNYMEKKYDARIANMKQEKKNILSKRLIVNAISSFQKSLSSFK